MPRRKRWILLLALVLLIFMIWAGPVSGRKTVPPPAEQTFAGSVKAVNEHACEICKWVELSATLDTGTETLEVKLGPKQFLERSNFVLSVDDSIVVTGVRYNERGTDVVLATEVEKGTKKLVLRGRDRQPAWIAERGHICPVCGN